MSLYPTCLETSIVTLSNDLLETYYKPLHIHNSDLDIAKIDYFKITALQSIKVNV